MQPLEGILRLGASSLGLRGWAGPWFGLKCQAHPVGIHSREAGIYCMPSAPVLASWYKGGYKVWLPDTSLAIIPMSFCSFLRREESCINHANN